MRRSRHFVSCLCVWLGIAGTAATPASAIKWTSIDYPGQAYTQLHGVSGSKILGTWYDFPNNVSGHFLYDAGTFTPLNLAVPGSGDSTLPWKLDGDTIVGSYLDETFSLRAFHFDGTNYHTILMPASTSSWAKDVSGGVIVGDTFFESGGNVFRLDSSTLSVFGYPGATLTSPEAISGSTIVGFYGPGLDAHGFVYDETGWTTLDYPGASRTRLLGVSDAGIVGQFGFNDPFVHSFLYAQGAFQELSYPGSLSTEVWDMDGNFIVGNYADGNGVHGFLAIVPEPATAVLFGVGLIGLLGASRRKSAKKLS